MNIPTGGFMRPPFYDYADVTLSSDFMTGFCGETEEDHRDTLTLMEAVQYDMAYMFAYSMRKVLGHCWWHSIIVQSIRE